MLNKLKRAYEFVRQVVVEFAEDRGALFAAAIAFFGLLSFIPLILLAVGVFGYIIGSFETALARVLDFARDFLPVAPQALEEELQIIIDQSGLLSGVGLLIFLWTGSQVFFILQSVMNVALNAEQRVGFVRGRLMAFLMVIVVGVLFALSIGITSLMAVVRGYDIEVLGVGPDDIQPVWDFAGILLTVFISALAFSFVYKFLPTRNIGWAAPIIGGVTAGILFEVAKYGFSWYVGNIADFSRVYGSLGGLVILVLWVYYVSLIMVLGAELASVYARRTQGEGGR